MKLSELIHNIFSGKKSLKKAGGINPTIPLSDIMGEDRFPQKDSLNCDQVFALLDKFVEYDLGDEDAKEKMPDIHLHLKNCQECSHEYKTLITIYKKLKNKQ